MNLTNKLLLFIASQLIVLNTDELMKLRMTEQVSEEFNSLADEVENESRN